MEWLNIEQRYRLDDCKDDWDDLLDEGEESEEEGSVNHPEDCNCIYCTYDEDDFNNECDGGGELNE